MLLGCSRSVQLAQVREHSCGVTEALLPAWQEDLRNSWPRSAMKPSIIDEGDGERYVMRCRSENLCAGTGNGNVSMGLGRRTEFADWETPYIRIRVFTC